jgi:hypothetical protein
LFFTGDGFVQDLAVFINREQPKMMNMEAGPNWLGWGSVQSQGLILVRRPDASVGRGKTQIDGLHTHPTAFGSFFDIGYRTFWPLP